MDTFKLSRLWFDFNYDNDESRPIHTALFFYSIHLNNKLGWKQRFSMPTDTAMENIGVKSYKTYISALLDVANWGFIIIHERSKNQHTSNIIELVKNTSSITNSTTKAHDKALSNHYLNHCLLNVSIDKPNNLTTQEPNNIKGASAILSISFEDCKTILFSSPQWQMVFQKNNEVDDIQFEQLADEFLKKIETGEEFKNYKYANETRTHFNNWFNQQRTKKELATKHNKPSFEEALSSIGRVQPGYHG